ncbi:serine/threonine-protein phosphatase 2A regulatory subunit B'' subunit beta isoform X2 [Apodemus sylvaticus]|uniref:serine/threonine-protein phosphatase 2A regulatory subunit B'' subunit beta isoform X2 n=1 Tax=Apodemus sylvaticus TaxID=10129 RepID=UPI002242F60D|nr:serine/threonine-protein phosphatase 2A regulatory subunit B'' subunit beta isoform X2 [Apodemus sylvaticus]
MDPAERRSRLLGSRSPAAAAPTPSPPPTRTRAPSLRRDPDDPAVRQALAALARGCDLVFPSRFRKRLRDFRQVDALREEPPPPAPPPGPFLPAFYFPRGRPLPNTLEVDDIIAEVERVFALFPQGRAGLGDMSKVAKACRCPLYWKSLLFSAAGGERTGSLSVHKFVAMWRKVLLTCHDDASKFLQLLSSPGSRGLVQEDFVPFLQDVVNSHPGLSFLKEASEFHSRYITTVIQRIFYTVNRSWSGRITCEELRRSNFLQAVSLLEAEPDINQLTDYFSYEHFYVIYCKFWELDTDHDLMIDRRDLARHADGAISSRMIDRIFSGAVTRSQKLQKDGKISYADFVWFLLSEEDKTTPTSTEYWFRCMDLDGDGALSMFELEFFYEEQARRLQARAVEPLPFCDLACQVLDLVQPQNPGRITLSDLKRCKLAGAFFDAFFNVDKYLEREQLEQDLNSDPELSDWEKYAAEEYDFLVAEEAAGDAWEDGLDRELSMLGVPLGSVDLYSFADHALEPL